MGSVVKNISLENIKPLLNDLFEHKPVIYWTDFIISITIGWSAFVFLNTESVIWLKVLYFFTAAFALYRSLIFTHELAHLNHNKFKLFRWVWNVLCGCPLLLPSFTYHGVHNDHHVRAKYGTDKDGEYLPFGVEPPYKIFFFLASPLFIPLYALFRFLLLTPLSMVIPALRKWTWKHYSSLTFNWSYQRPEVSAHNKINFLLQDLLTSSFAWIILILISGGVLSANVLLYGYMVAVMIAFLNALRTLAAHLYLNPGDRSMNTSEQILDSVNVTGNRFITSLWAPVGLRFHGLHHMFPAMPYHSFRKAHLRLIEKLPQDNPYRKTVYTNLYSVLKVLVKNSKNAAKSATAS